MRGDCRDELGRAWTLDCVIHRYGRDSFPRLGLIYTSRVGFFHQSTEQVVMQHSHGDDVVVFPGMEDFQDLISFRAFIFRWKL